MPPRARTPAPALTEEHTPTSAPAEQTAAEAEPDRGGWFRNTGPVDLVVLGDGATAVLAPGRIAHLKRTPTHRDLAPASESDFDAQQAADAARAEAEAPAAEPTTEPAPEGAADESATEA